MFETSDNNGGALLGCGSLVCILFVLSLVGQCTDDAEQPYEDMEQSALSSALTSGIEAGALSISRKVYVSANNLNCREKPNKSAPIATRLKHNDIIYATREKDGWLFTEDTGTDCWFSDRFVSDTRQPEPSSAPIGSTSTGVSGRHSGGTCGPAPYCSGISSCEEAYFYLNECGVTRLDRDNDGVPCESVC